MDFEKSLNNLCWDLVIEEPFYGLFLTELNKRFVEEKEFPPTACVAKAPDSVNVSLLINKGFWNEEQEEIVLKQISEQIDTHLQKAEEYPKADPLDMFNHVYAEESWHINEQQQELKQILKKDVKK